MLALLLRSWLANAQIRAELCQLPGRLTLKNAEPTLSDRPVGVELLILRILRRGFAGTLVTGAIGAMACASEVDDPKPTTEQNPSPVGASDGAVATLDGGKTADAGTGTPSKDARVPSNGDAGAKGDAGATDAASAPDGATPAPTCTAERALSAAGFTTADTFDYVAVREAQGFNDGPPSSGVDAGTGLTWTREQFMTLSETGSSCATATDPQCAATVARHPAQFVLSYCVDACVEYSVVTTHGNEVKRWATDDELLALLGKVDAVDEALLFATRAGFHNLCGDQQPDGLRVVGTRYKATCPIVYERLTMRVSDTGKLEVVNAVELPDEPGTGACVGRVPAGLCSVSEARHESAVGDFLAHCAHLEDASVYAFERLARELTAYGAPRDMIAASLHAADDEVRHARVVGELAQARGGKAVVAEVQTLALRTLEEIATENATEGCVRETYGALVGGYQARHAHDLGIRTAMREVAADEARHAALSHRVHSWAMAQLSSPERARVLSAQRRAIAELTRECKVEVDTRIREPLGLPSAEVAQALLRELSLSLWETDESNEHGVAAAMVSWRRAV